MSASTKAVLIQALEAMIAAQPRGARPADWERHNAAIASLRAALAEGEAFKPDWANYRQGLEDGRAETEQAEPVAWLVKTDDDDDLNPMGYIIIASDTNDAIKELAGAFPVYRHPSPAALRAAVIEECAQVAHEHMDGQHSSAPYADGCAAAIRALKEQS